MQQPQGLGWVWFTNLGIPLLILGLSYGCGGEAFILKSPSQGDRSSLFAEPLRPSATALEGRATAMSLASRWSDEAQLIRVDGFNVRLDGRLTESATSTWVYYFHRPSDGMFFRVTLDGRGNVVGQPSSTMQSQSLWVEPLDRWVVDSPAVAQQVAQARLPMGEDLDMQLTRDGVWRITAEDGQFLHEIHIDALTGRRLLARF